MRSTLTRRADARRRTPQRALASATLALTLAAPAALASTTAAAAPAGDPTGDPDRAAVGYLIDGLAAQSAPTAGNVADVVLAAAAAGSGRGAVEAAFADLDGLDELQPGPAAKVLLAAAALDDTEAADDAETALRGAIDAGDAPGRVGGSTQIFVQALAVLALETTTDGAPSEVVDFLVAQACDDDSYVWQGRGNCSAGGEADTTALAAQALMAADQDADAQIAWLLDAQDPDTGAFAVAERGNSNSTALAAQALRADGSDQAVAAADDAAAHVASLFEGCDAPAAVRGSYRFTADDAGDRRIATSQAVFATADRMDLLSVDGATVATERLNCADTFCPPDTGISVAVDFTTLAPDAGVEVRCATDLPDDPDGFDVLEAAGFDVETQDFGWGTALCSIDGRPELEDGDCLSPTSDGFYGYFNAPQGGDWSAYDVGAGDSAPQVGTIEGFAWAPDFVGGPPRVSTTPAGFVDLTPPPTPTPPYDRGLDAACPGEYPLTFSDVPPGSTHARAIACLSSTPIVQGTGDGTTFSPSLDVSRDQIASLLVRTVERATGGPLPVGAADFDDIAGNFHADAIRKLASAGVIRGTGDGSSFSPRAPLSRQQMATLLDRTLDLLDNGAVDRSFPPVAAATGVFSDVPNNVHGPAIDRLANQGVVAGRTDGTFGPTEDVRRDQVVSFVARALDLAVTEGFAPPVDGD